MTEGLDADPDTALSGLLEGWRSRLAKAVACSSPQRSTREISEGVHGLILRLVLLAFLEAGGHLPPETLSGSGPGTPKDRLFRLFTRLEQEFQLVPEPGGPGTGTGSYGASAALSDLGDETVARILAETPLLISFFRNDPALVRFPVIYDRFLARDIFRHGGALIRIEEPPGAGSLWRNVPVPEALVRHIVEASVGRAVQGRSLCEISDVWILDPSCGSGRFLLAAYRFLAGFCESWYREHLVPLLESGREPSRDELDRFLAAGADTREYPVRRDSEGRWNLTPAERRRILETHLFGLDPDPRSVAAAQAFICLMATCPGQKIPGEHVPHCLRNQVLRGNFLIGPDIFLIPDMVFVPDRVRAELAAWDGRSGFPVPAGEGGFSVVIGNFFRLRVPQGTGLQEYLQTRYTTYHGEPDPVPYAVERSIAFLRSDGRFGGILPDRWLRAGYAAGMRDLVRKMRIEEIGRVPARDEPGAPPNPCALIFSKQEPGSTFRVLDISSAFSGQVPDLPFPSHNLMTGTLGASGWTLEDPRKDRILAKVRRAGKPLGDSLRGPILFGAAQKKPGEPGYGGMFVRYGRYGTARPARRTRPPHLRNPRILLHRPSRTKERILLHPSYPRVICTFQRAEAPVPAPCVLLPSGSPVLLAILNSRLFSFVLAANHETGSRQPEERYSWEEVARAPVLTLDLEDRGSRDQYEKLAYYVGRMLDLTTGSSGEAEPDGERQIRDREIRLTDAAIDGIVYELFGISDEEQTYIRDYESRRGS